MENGAFDPNEQMLPIHDIFKYMIFQRHQKVLLWSKGLNMKVFIYTKRGGSSVDIAFGVK